MGYRIPTNFAKVGVEGSNPFARSRFPQFVLRKKNTKRPLAPTGMIMD
jgi:hypothetical protein